MNRRIWNNNSTICTIITRTIMLRLLLITIVAAMSVSGEIFDLEHELLTGEVAIGQALIGKFHTAEIMGKQIEEYLVSSF